MTMTVITKEIKSLVALKLERQALKGLIDKRNAWLMDPVNQKRGTFNSVKTDTMEMTWKLSELDRQIDGMEKDLETNNTNAK